MLRDLKINFENKKRSIYDLLAGKYGERRNLIVLWCLVIITLIIIKAVDSIFGISTDISLYGLIIGAIGLIISSYFTYQHGKEYSTYFREFRGYMTKLDELLKNAGVIIEEAEESIKIAVDFFGIGWVTAREAHEIYMGSLYKMAQKEKIKVTVIVLSPEIARKRTREEFPKRANEEPEFIQAVIKNDIKICNAMKNMDITTKSNPSIPFHLFIVDDKKALFYMEEPVKEDGEKRKTVGYVTEDSRMLDVFKELFRRIDDDSEQCEWEDIDTGNFLDETMSPEMIVRNS